jgi:hypothetical protein
MKKVANLMHKELLELVETLSDTSTSSDGSSVRTESDLEHQTDKESGLYECI